jgi:hypothetical protein
VTREGARTIASTGEAPVTEAVRVRVEAYLSAELLSTEMVTATVHDEPGALAGEQLWTVDREAALFPVLLRARRDQDELIAGVVLLRITGVLPLPPERDLLHALGQALLLDAISGMRADV